MKSFWKMTLAVVVGILIVSIVTTVLSFMFIGSVAAIGKSSATVPAGAVLKIDMEEIMLAEQTKDADINIQTIRSGMDQPAMIGIWDAIQGLEKAAADPNVKFIYMTPDGASGGMAEFEEFRKALVKFRDSGKPVISYIENPGNASYYLASASDKIYMSSCEGGMNTIVGLATRIVFLKDLLDKLGVNVQLIRHGKYKSAGEMYIKNDISPENRLQYETFIGSIWKGWSETMAASRGMSAEKFNGLIDYLALNSPEDFLAAGLVDSLYTREQLLSQLCSISGADKPEQIKTVSLADYISAKVVPNYRAKDKIAVVYADGEIIDGDMKQEVAGDHFASVISKVRKDSTIKAVVFRVSSPGGSVLASEKIRNEIKLLQQCKPVVASYGNYAASGGYWISASCDKIYSDASTLTGSIGVFSMLPDFSKTAKNIAHVNIVNISSNAHGDMYGGMRPLSVQETAYMQASVEDIYDKFTSIVAEGRSLDKNFVDDIAQGRVWAGSDAIGIGLVDEIGTIEDAIRYAAEVANGETGSDLDNWQIVAYPKPQTVFEQLLEQVTGKHSDENIFAGTPFEGVATAFKDFNATSAGKAYARLPYSITIE